MRGGAIAAVALVAGWAAACGLSVTGVQDGTDSGVPPGGSTTTSSGSTSTTSSSGSSSSSSGSSSSSSGGSCSATVDFATNGLHCGSCNHDCLGGGCAAGRCLPSVFVSGESGITGVAVIGADLWWTREAAGQVRKMPLAGGAAMTMITQVAHPTDVAGLDGHVFVVDRGAEKVSRFEASAPDVHTWTIGNEPTPSGVSAAGTNVYWATQVQDGVGRVGVSGAPLPTVRLPAQNYPADVFVVGTTMYFASGSGIVSAPSDDGQPQTILSPTSRFKDGGGDLIHTGLAVEGNTVFFTIGELNLVASVPTTGGVATLLARTQSNPQGIAATPTAIYWANSGDGTIMRLAR